MRKILLLMVACILFLGSVAPPIMAQGTPEVRGRDAAFEQEILDRLSAINPEAAVLFQQATESADAGDFDSAKTGFERVLALAPDFPDALRRLSNAELYLGEVEAAEQHARQALQVQDSPYNHSALARVLSSSQGSDKAAEALDHARVAAQALPEARDIQMSLMLAGLAAGDIGAMREGSSAVVRLAPENPLGHYIFGLTEADRRHWIKAERELLLAQKLGMSTEIVQQTLDDGVSSNARSQRLLYGVGYAVGGWLVGLGLLLAMGVLLSKSTLAAVQRTQATGEFEASPSERRIRSLYRIVIIITSLYFYVSIPFLILLVLAMVGGIFYLFFVMERIPVRLALFIIIAALYTLYAVVRSIFTRLRDGEPGRAISSTEAPLLWALVEEVATRVGTRPVDAVYLMPGVGIAVTERGALLDKYRGRGQRCLLLGLGALGDTTQRQLRAILAHEYGHFAAGDTAGGNLANQVYWSIQHMAYRLAASGQARLYNPVWVFIGAFQQIYLRVTLGASRLQEILADRTAALAYGPGDLVSALTQIVRQTLTFNLQVGHEVELAETAHRRTLPNAYILPPLEAETQQKRLQEELDQAMNQATSPFDSHPALRDRLALIKQIPNQSEEGDDGARSWDLLPHAEVLQQEMTLELQKSIWQ